MHSFQARRDVNEANVQKNKRLEYAFTTVSITTGILGAAVLAFPEKVCAMLLSIGSPTNPLAESACQIR